MYPRKVDAEVEPKPDPGALAREQGQGIFSTEGGSNFLTAERYAAATGHSNTGASAEQLFGPVVHEKVSIAPGPASPAAAAGAAVAAFRRQRSPCADMPITSIAR